MEEFSGFYPTISIVHTLSIIGEKKNYNVVSSPWKLLVLDTEVYSITIFLKTMNTCLVVMQGI